MYPGKVEDAYIEGAASIDLDEVKGLVYSYLHLEEIGSKTCVIIAGRCRREGRNIGG